MDSEGPQVLIRNAKINIVNGTYIHRETRTTSRISNAGNVGGVEINAHRAPNGGGYTAPYQSHAGPVDEAVQRIGPNARVYNQASYDGRCYSQSTAVLDPNEVFTMSETTSDAIDILFENADWDGTRGHPQAFATQTPNIGSGFVPQHPYPEPQPALDAAFTHSETATTTTVATNTNTISYNAVSHTVRA